VIDRSVEVVMLDFCRRERLALIAYSPLGHDFRSLMASDRRGVLKSVASEVGRTPAQVALNWLIAKDNVFAIPKTESVEHALENVAAADWRLSEEQVRRLDAGMRHVRRGRFTVAMRRMVRRTAQRVRGRA
jgi:diketogulonate reductase-like aldo/keto reductase